MLQKQPPANVAVSSLTPASDAIAAGSDCAGRVTASVVPAAPSTTTSGTNPSDFITADLPIIVAPRSSPAFLIRQNSGNGSASERGHGVVESAATVPEVVNLSPVTFARLSRVRRTRGAFQPVLFQKCLARCATLRQLVKESGCHRSGASAIRGQFNDHPVLKHSEPDPNLVSGSYGPRSLDSLALQVNRAAIDGFRGKRSCLE